MTLGDAPVTIRFLRPLTGEKVQFSRGTHR
jgi:hypothetical protein